jgi:MFS transporter, NNP family, nitrate/nitrite transporter
MTDTLQSGLNVLRLEPRIKVLHLTWLAFFVSFVVWFNHAPLMAAIRTSLRLTDHEVSAPLILNVALTIPARIVIGMLVDKFGPRLVYAQTRSRLWWRTCADPTPNMWMGGRVLSWSATR